MVAAGHGTLRAGDIRAVLASVDRSNAAPIAPPHGLCLWEVAY
jgi:tRNA U38,U39,U40 pseudouridine synthase TruA